ncbi:MAG: multidrug efflux RND transporter permease subunit [Polyangiales bacterium]
MFSAFFIRRPVLASVFALIIVLLGAIAIPRLPVAQYPDLAMPRVYVSTNYNGASAETVETAVITPLEQQINGVAGMKSMSSNAGNNGDAQISVTFEAGTNVDIAAVDVQNRVATASPLLPAEVRQGGIQIFKTTGSSLMAIALYDETGKYDPLFVSNYAEIYLRDALKRIPGVGNVEVFGARRFSLRVWIDPAKLASRGLTTSDVVAALSEQNVQVAAGQIGRPPAPSGHAYQLTVRARGRLSEPREFESIVLRSGPQGAQVRLGDVARAELGAEDYGQLLQFNGKDTSGLDITQLPKANALKVARAVKAELARLSSQFPTGLRYDVAFDTTLAVEESIDEVLASLSEAIVLVVLVILLFLQGLRATLIPTVVIPVSLVGTFMFVKLMGFSINTLTLFGLTLATGLVVDDAIVVIENIARHLEERRTLAPREAAEIGMREVFAPVIAISLVLVAVFVPVAMFPGSTGVIYQQFALTIAFSVALSTFVSVTLTPALAALLLRPPAGEKWVGYRWVDRGLERLSGGYLWLLAKLLRHRVTGLALFAATLALTWLVYRQVPTGFIPDEDQGWFAVMINGPDGSSSERTGKVLTEVQEALAKEKSVESVFAVGGYSFMGDGPNRGVVFANMRPWSERRDPSQSLTAVLERLKQPFSRITGADVMGVPPPTVEGIGNVGGFQFVLQDRTLAASLESVAAATRQLVAEAKRAPELGGVFSSFSADDPQLLVNVDRERAKALGVGLDQVFSTLQVSLGAQYVNDFDFANRAYRVYVQAEASHRDSPGDVGALYVRTDAGKMVPLEAFVRVTPTTSAQVINHFNMFRSVDVSGTPAPGYSSGEALAAMERVARAALPAGFDFEWTGLSREELESRGQTAQIFLLGLFFVFLVLAGQYESFTLPFVVLLGVPVAVLGALLAQLARGLPNDVFCQVGMVMLVGLTGKNAILIVEFASQLRERGEPRVAAALRAAETRLRPILMTSIAFLLGVVPLMLANGAGSAARRSLGTAVFGGMLLSTALNLFFTPLLFVMVDAVRSRVMRREAAA